MTFHQGLADGLPAVLRILRIVSRAIVGEHGSWDRTPLNGYKVVYVPFAGGRPSGPPQDLLTGFLTRDKHARGRPVGVGLDSRGALLVADDLGNTVWRVSGTAQTTSAVATTHAHAPVHIG